MTGANAFASLLVLPEATFQFQLTACHLPGTHNTLADLLSRNNLPRFYSKVPTANQEPTPIPQHLARPLLAREGDWTSPTWTNSLNFSTLEVKSS